ncbi:MULTISPECIES: PHA/PHB synthase family protein [Candidatus Ichthyocystis]|uniref:Putative poly-beta-hydroxybutyrate polymerase n=1 Tax=Candidatus Ichthyocystis hellenicum TaxID=1561003 RepID=A0A0S4M3L5_9BURK|nr:MULTISPECIES: alpha/beta fold hydrolase [Ichthyocystis]CUT17883.1 putative poly-beta-hydroxybutyrate polymerase [Candidatus Ichthyocystis hellenicum]
MVNKFYLQQREVFFLLGYATHVFSAIICPYRVLIPNTVSIPSNSLSSDFWAMVTDIRDRHLDICNRIIRKDPSLLYDDGRFSDNLWKRYDYFHYIHQLYLLFCDFIERYLGVLFFSYHFTDIQNYLLKEWIVAINPANYFFTNPVALTESIRSSGETVRRGLNLLSRDIRNIDIGRVPDGHFKVGDNLATTPGVVVFKTDLYEIISYNHPSPVHPPIVFFPACVNKFYILDLQKENSLVRFCLSHGHQVFMLSWYNRKYFTLKNYVYALIDSMDIIRKITGYDQLHVLGYCIGGFLLYMALMILSSQNRDWVCSATLLTSMINSSYSGILGSFIQKETIDLIKIRSNIDPVIYGHELSWMFAFIRSDSLVWSYVRERYLMGREAEPFDILAWNADHIDVSAIMLAEYLELLYLKNVLMQDYFFWDGYSISSKMITCPMYLISCLRDSIVPWKSVYSGISSFPNASIRFALSCAGHTAGVVSPPHNTKRSYFAEDYSFLAKGKDILSCSPNQGSWWLDWCKWLRQSHAFKNNDHEYPYTPLYKAPGMYVFKGKANA